MMKHLFLLLALLVLLLLSPVSSADDQPPRTMDLVWFEMTYGFDSPAWNPSVEEVDAVVCFTNDWMRDRVVAYLGQDEITGRNVFRRQAIELRVVSHYMDWDLMGDDQLVVTLFAYIQDKSNGEVVDPSTSFRAFELTSEDATAYVTNYVWNIVDTNNLFYYTNRIEVRARLNEPIPSNDEEIKLQKSICEKDETRSPTASPVQPAQATPAPTSLPAQDTPEPPAGPPDNENNNPSSGGSPGDGINFPPLPDTNPTSPSTSSTPEPATPPTSAPTAQETTAETPQQPTTGAPTTDTPTESPTDRPTTSEPTASPMAVVPESTPEPTTGTSSSTQPSSVAPPTGTDTTETTATDDDTNTNNNADSNSNNEESPSETAAPATTPTTNDNPSFVIGGPNNNNQDESTTSQGGPPATDGTTISTVAWRMVFHWPQTTTMTDIIREPTRTEMVHVLCQFQRFLEKRLERATKYAPIAVELTEATWKLSNATSMVVNFVSNSYYVLSEEGGLYDHVPPNVVVAAMQQDEQIQEQQYLMGYIRNETTTGNNNNVIDNIVHEATHLEIQPWALCSKLPPGRLRVAVCSAKTLVDPSADILGIPLDLETIPSEFEGYGQELLGPRPCEARTSPPRNSTNGSGGGSSDSDDEREMYNTRAPLAYQDVQKRAYRLEVSFTVSNLDGITSPTDVNRTGLDVAFPWFVAGLMEEFYGGSVGRRYLRVGRNLYDGPVRLSYVQNSAWVDSIESMDCIGDNVHPDLICHQVLGVYSLVADPIRITRRSLQASQQQTVTAGNTPWQVLVLQETYKRIHDGTFYGVLKTKAPETPLLIGTIPPPESGGGMGALYALMAVCIALALCICCLVRMLMLSKQRREEEWKRRLSRQKSKLNLNDDDDLSTTSKQRPNKRNSKKHDDDDQKASNKTIDTTGSTNPSTPTEFMDEDAVLAYYEDLAQDEDIDSNTSDDRKQEKDKEVKDAASETETDTENNYKNVSTDEDWGDSNDNSDDDDESSITGTPDYEQMKVSELRKLCQDQGISTAGMFEKREMVDALQALNSKSGSSTAPNVGRGGMGGESSNDNDDSGEIPDYEQMKVSELRKLCQTQGISTAGMFEKREMVGALQALNSKSSSATPNSGRGGMGGESSNGNDGSAEIPDYDQMKISELRKLCQAKRISTAGLFEKKEMVDALQATHGT